VGSVRYATPFTASIVATCSSATVGNEAVNQCVQIATSSGYDTTQVIRSCQQATVGNGALLQCVQSSVR